MGKPKLDKNGVQKTGLFFRSVAVWNAQQVGAEALVAEERDPVEVLDGVEDFIANCGADIRTVEGSNSAHYSPIKDHIVLPSINRFYRRH
jgi:antirestriction protein ArdC